MSGGKRNIQVLHVVQGRSTGTHVNKNHKKFEQHELLPDGLHNIFSQHRTKEVSWWSMRCVTCNEKPQAVLLGSKGKLTDRENGLQTSSLWESHTVQPNLLTK